MQTNFQALLITDERISFVIFLYDEDTLSFTGSHEAGFDAGDRMRHLSIKLDVQERVFRIDGAYFDVVSSDAHLVRNVSILI